MQTPSRRPSFKQLNYFVELSRSLNFRRAAEKLGVSQPTLTAQINTLEDILGLSLFERSRSGTFLSPQGRELIEPARHLLGALHSFEEAAHYLAEGASTTFKLGVPPTSGPYLLPFILPELHERYDKLKLYVREAAPRQLEEGLVNGDFDLILSPLPIMSPELALYPLFSEPLKFVMPVDHELAGHAQIDAKTLKGKQVLSLEEHHHFHRQVKELCASLGAELLRDYEGTSLDTLRQMVVMGLGVTFLPGLYIHSELHKPEALHVCELKDRAIIEI